MDNQQQEQQDHGLGEALGRLRSAMAPEAVARAERLGRINRAYVRTGRDKELAAAIDSLIESALAWESGQSSKRRALFVVGDSGSGKTTAIQKHISERREFDAWVAEDGEVVRPLVSFEAPKPLTLKLLATKALEAIGYKVHGNIQENQAWDLLKRQLRERRVLFLHIDEMQHVIRGNKEAAIQNLADTVKSLLQIPGWPLHVIFSGVPSLAKFLRHETQLRNRSLVVRFDPLAFPEHAKLVRACVGRIIESDAGLKPEGVLEDEVLHRLIHASEGAFGTLIQFVRAAAENMLRSGGDAVNPASFARAYRLLTGCPDSQNVFLVEDWLSVEPANALASLIEDYDRSQEGSR